MPTDSRKISVVIPVKNGEDTIGDCLAAVFSQTLPPLEVIVVDGYSTDRTFEVASKFPVKFIYEDYGTVGGARQVGLENAKGEYVAFTDADCIPERDWLENLVKAFEDGYVGVGGGIKHIGKRLWGNSMAFIMDTFLGSGNSVQGRLFRNKRVVKSISGCNSLYRKKDLMEVGGFNVNLSINEDTELNTRLSRFGNLLYTPDAIVLHNQDRGLKDFAQRMYQFGYGRGKLRLWDLQCVPPSIIPVLLFSLLFTPWLFLGGIILYCVVLVVMGLRAAWFKRDIKYMFSIPIVYLIEHLSYSIGFWRGLFTSLKGKFDENHYNCFT